MKLIIEVDNEMEILVKMPRCAWALIHEQTHASIESGLLLSADADELQEALDSVEEIN